MTHPNLHDMILLVNQHQLMIRNLFQTEKGWRANIGNGMDAAEFGEGACIESALDDAIDKAVAKGLMKREKPFYIRDQKPATDPFADD